MACKHAIITEVVTVTDKTTVADAIEALSKNNIRMAPVVNDDGTMVGMFSFHHVLSKLLPVAARIDRGLEELDFVIGAGPEIAKHMKEIKAETVGEHMDPTVYDLHPETSTLEAIRMLVKFGSPLPVIEKKDGSFAGIISEQSLIEQMSKDLPI